MTAPLPTEPESLCACCGMSCTPREYHPYAACLMFQSCHNSTTVRANLSAVLAQGRESAADVPADRRVSCSVCIRAGGCPEGACEYELQQGTRTTPP